MLSSHSHTSQGRSYGVHGISTCKISDCMLNFTDLNKNCILPIILEKAMNYIIYMYINRII